MIDITQKASAGIVQEYDVIRLSREEQTAFVSAVLNPPEPGERLRQAAESYRQRSEEDCPSQVITLKTDFRL
jgi:uncharacterized protein (DUF1778 family)